MERKRSSQAGFTLIELAIAIAVIAILVGAVAIGVGSLSRDAKVNNLVDFVDKYKSIIETAKLKCDLNALQSAGTDATNISTALQNCGVLNAGENLPTQVQGATVSYDLTTVAKNGKYKITITNLGDTTTLLETAIEKKYNNTNICTADTTNASLTCTLPNG